MRELISKVVMLGSQVGKTSVILRLKGSRFDKHVSPTIGASYCACKVNLGHMEVKMQVWDTAGQERFRAMAPLYYRNTNAAILVYDITSYSSFVDLKSWVEELNGNVDNPLVLCLLGNKHDLEDRREVPTEEAFNFAASIGAVFQETSAYQNTGVEEAFYEVAVRISRLCDSLLRLNSLIENGNNTNMNDVIDGVLGHQGNTHPHVDNMDMPKCC
ncbi:PREDICTED: ras-related protein Rab-31-like isoform X2 [Priapulus caudatus]|uniref:Ras-related protein Rab-31-like isoform X2 n=1 Tax=Priapulus caudatus TaxID=37621 RepID=A0ABM1DUU2_PRICU|nr:PREDICTED: ras-related protein Rab-31-like isoform X2 [Priapulus caudatus]